MILPEIKTLIVIISLGVVILMFALVRGCQNEKKSASIVIDFKGRINKLTQDSIDNANQLTAYKDTMQFMDGQLSLSKNKELSLNEDLGKANHRITALLKKHVPIQPSSDTSAVLVPNDYLVDCKDCFEELGNGQKLVRKYKEEKDNQEKIYKGQLNLKDNRINNLEKSNINLTAGYKSLIDSSKKMQDVLNPRGRLYLSWGVLWKDYVPWAAGAGLMYQNKRSLIIGASWYYNSKGHMIQTNVHFPLSLKKR